jgi:hypothetical protein
LIPALEDALVHPERRVWRVLGRHEGLVVVLRGEAMLEDEVVVEAEAFLEDVRGANLAGGLDLSGGHGEVALLEEGLGPAVRLAGVLGQVLAGGGVEGAGFAPGRVVRLG